MIVAWLTYTLLVGALVSLAAVVAERAARAQGWPGRWVWAGALALTVGVPLATWLVPGSPAPRPVPVLPAMPGAYVMDALPTVSAAAGGGVSPATLLLAGWAAVSAGLLLVVAALALRMRAALRRWPLRRVEGVEVLVSSRTGPAAMGVLRGRVVVPEWALGLDRDRRRLLVLHEAEHVRAMDPQLALVGLLVCVLAPWHLPLWWQLARLRLAIEVDCDARVLRRSGDAHGYGTLLVEVGQRRAHLALALAEPRSMLERRIRMMTRTTTGRRTLRALALGAVATVVLAVACETPGPTELTSPEPDAVTVDEVRLRAAEGECTPAYVLNGSPATADVVESQAPDGIERIQVVKGVGAADAVEVGADAGGSASGSARGLAAAASDRASAAASDGASDAASRCGVVLVVTKDATPEERRRSALLAEALTRRAAGPRPTLSLDEVMKRPMFTPMHERPTLRNAAEVMAALQRNYPPLLKTAGIGGTVNVWFLVDAEGAVRRTLVNKPSDHQALDAAALRTAEAMRFTPARLDGEPVPVWIALDIRFDPSVDAGARARQQETPAAEDGTRERSVLIRKRAVGDEETDGPAQPTFTPMTQRPTLRNAAATSRALQEHYPPMLREAGIGGTTNVWFFIDAEGQVARVRVNRSSGHEALDAAALEVARGMEFTPAKNREEPVAVWVALDLTFEAP